MRLRTAAPAYHAGLQGPPAAWVALHAAMSTPSALPQVTVAHFVMPCMNQPACLDAQHCSSQADGGVLACACRQAHASGGLDGVPSVLLPGKHAGLCAPAGDTATVPAVWQCSGQGCPAPSD